jgi:hypothetical protein
VRNWLVLRRFAVDGVRLGFVTLQIRNTEGSGQSRFLPRRAEHGSLKGCATRLLEHQKEVVPSCRRDVVPAEGTAVSP